MRHRALSKVLAVAAAFLLPLTAAVATPPGAQAALTPSSRTASSQTASAGTVAFLADWAPNVAYTAGTRVTYNGVTYECVQSHTSQTGWEPPNVPALWKIVTGGGDTQAPSVPGGLRSTGVTSSSVSLAWSASTDNVGVSGYDVYRGSARVATVTGTSYTDSGLSASTAYTY
ncbi:carbohydrate-binding protein, partial [Nonomuraea sp. NPDC050383]|uniref:carbohydrate-binding protein n=1 Tax=Nonomuraea sp. NPDC050383 TaxID=3364362 RepID=UPI00379DD2DA